MKNSVVRLSPCPAGFGSIADSVEEGVLGNPLQHTHEYFSDEQLGLYVGVWDTTDMLEAAEPYSMDEFMLVLEGKAVIKDNLRNTSTTVNAGETFVIPKGYDCQWQQQGYLRKFFFISCHPDEPIPSRPAHQGVVLPKAAKLGSKPVNSNPFISNDIGDTHYTDTTGRFNVNNWATQAFESQARPFPYFQLSIIQSGSIEIIDEQYMRHSFVTGDAFFIRKGAMCSAQAQHGASCISVSLNA